MNSDTFSDVIRPRFRIFFSADLVGSTRLKQERQKFVFFDSSSEMEELSEEEKDHVLSQYRPDWFTSIENFFSDFRRIFLNELRIARRAVDGCFENGALANSRLGDGFLSIEVWKTIGDEVVFVAEVSDADQITLLAFSFRYSIIYFRKISQREFDIEAEIPARRFYYEIQNNRNYGQLGVDIKCTMWSAAFPATNKEIVSLRSDTDVDYEDFEGHNPTIINLNLMERWYEGDVDMRANLTRDFIGPSIDTGFRVSTYSRPSRLVISLDVAYLLSISNLAGKISENLPIHFDDRITFKGVIGGDPYPIFWIDSSLPKGLADLESKLSFRAGPLDRELIEKYCVKFYNQHQKYIRPPRILTDHNEKITGIPADHEEFLRNLDAIWRSEGQRFAGRGDFG